VFVASIAITSANRSKVLLHFVGATLVLHNNGFCISAWSMNVDSLGHPHFRSHVLSCIQTRDSIPGGLTSEQQSLVIVFGSTRLRVVTDLDHAQAFGLANSTN